MCQVAGGLNSALASAQPKQRGAVKVESNNAKKEKGKEASSPKLGFFGKRREEAKKKGKEEKKK